MTTAFETWFDSLDVGTIVIVQRNGQEAEFHSVQRITGRKRRLVRVNHMSFSKTGSMVQGGYFAPRIRPPREGEVERIEAIRTLRMAVSLIPRDGGGNATPGQDVSVADIRYAADLICGAAKLLKLEVIRLSRSTEIPASTTKEEQGS